MPNYYITHLPIVLIKSKFTRHLYLGLSSASVLMTCVRRPSVTSDVTWQERTNDDMCTCKSNTKKS